MLIPRGQAKAAPLSYDQRCVEIAEMATGVGARPVDIAYLPEEHATWAEAMRLLQPIWERHAALPLRAARYALQLPVDHIPQLNLVSRRLNELTGFRFASVSGTVSRDEFFAALATRTFPSTQFIRWQGNPLYTPAPDVLHEVGGHAVSLANRHLAELHRLAGLAAVAAADMPQIVRSIASVFWYTAEFGVVRGDGDWKAYGAGLLSSPSELSWFSGHADIRPFNVAEMIATHYDIDRFQPVLFGAESLEEVVDVAGRFFTDIIDHAGSSDVSEGPDLVIDVRDLAPPDTPRRRS